MLMRADVRHDTYTYRCIYSIKMLYHFYISYSYKILTRLFYSSKSSLFFLSSFFTRQSGVTIPGEPEPRARAPGPRPYPSLRAGRGPAHVCNERSIVGRGIRERGTTAYTRLPCRMRQSMTALRFDLR
jgi:hypothetical protein